MNIPGTQAKDKVISDKKTRDSKIKRVRKGNIAPGELKDRSAGALFYYYYVSGVKVTAPLAAITT